MDEDPTDTTLPRRQLGRLLRDARTTMGMTLDEAAAQVQWSRATLSRLERGESAKVRISDVSALCAVFGMSERATAVATGLAEQRPARFWWHAYDDIIPTWANLYVGLESAATDVTLFQPLIVPGLLQTADYARTIDRIYFANDTEEENERRVRVRIRRQRNLTRSPNPTQLSVVLHECVLRIVVGSPRLMSAQCRHIADISTSDNIDIRVLPYRAGFPTGASVPPFVIMDFNRGKRGKQVIEPSQVYCEGFSGSAYFERRTDVLAFRTAFQQLQQASLDTRPSRDLVREVARRYESEH